MSVANDILDAARALALAAPAYAARKRKRAELFDADVAELATTPVVLLVSEPESQVGGTSELETIIAYPVLVVYVAAGNQRYEEGQDAVRDAREDLRRRLSTTTLAGAAGVWDYELDFAPVFDAAAIATGYDYSAFRVTYYAVEPRQN